jgi:hypothetical protein
MCNKNLGLYFSGHHGLPSQLLLVRGKRSSDFIRPHPPFSCQRRFLLVFYGVTCLRNLDPRLVARVQRESWSPRGTWIGLRCLPQITSRAVSSSLPVYSQRTRSPPSRSKQSAARKKQGNPGCLLTCSMPKIKPLKVVETLPTSVVIQSVFQRLTRQVCSVKEWLRIDQKPMNVNNAETC